MEPDLFKRILEGFIKRTSMYTATPLAPDAALAFLDGLAMAGGSGPFDLDRWLRAKWSVPGEATSFTSLMRIKFQTELADSSNEARLSFLFATLEQYLDSKQGKGASGTALQG